MKLKIGCYYSWDSKVRYPENSRRHIIFKVNSSDRGWARCTAYFDKEENNISIRYIGSCPHQVNFQMKDNDFVKITKEEMKDIIMVESL